MSIQQPMPVPALRKNRWLGWSLAGVAVFMYLAIAFRWLRGV